MDFIFECFFEDTFEKISRNGLQDRSSRRDVLDHLNAVIGGCSDGQNVRTEEVARLAVLAAVRYHRDKKDANGDVCLMGKFHNILYIALRTCWDWGVRDSAVVVLLLEEIYACEKTFERIFLGALFGPNAPHFIAGWRSDFRDQDENTRAMVYFLHHATSSGMVLPVWIARYEQERMIKFIDIPIESCGRSSPLRVALQASAPDLLLILLRYGADPNPPDGGGPVVLALLDKLTENDRNYVFQNVSCLQILLRNIPIIEMPYKPILYGARREMFFERYGRLLMDKIICKEQVYGVMSLRHLCRCRIRELLRKAGQLPNGIDTLRLPKRLQRYIDLMEELEVPDKQKPTKNTNQRDTATTSAAGTSRNVVNTNQSIGNKPDAMITTNCPLILEESNETETATDADCDPQGVGVAVGDADTKTEVTALRPSEDADIIDSGSSRSESTDDESKEEQPTEEEDVGKTADHTPASKPAAVVIDRPFTF